jgi:hypothetical protein
LKKLRLEIFKSLPERNKLMNSLRKNEPTKKKQGNNKRNSFIPKISINTSKTIIVNNNSTNKRKAMKSKTSLITSNHTKKFLKRKKSVEYSLFARNGKNLGNKIYNKNISGDIEYNFLPYTEALNKDNGNFFTIFISIFKLKIEFIALLFYPEEFTYKSYTISMYTLGFLFGFFMNSLLYTDDIVSEKYHNNGKLNLLTTIFLSLTSNFISWIIGCFSKQFFIYNESLLLLIKDVKRKSDFILTFMKLYLMVKIISFGYYFLSFIFIITMTYYIVIFCAVYQESQNSLLINYIMGFIESIITSICITLVICVLRIIGLNFKNKYCYRTSVFLDQKL